MDPKCPSIFADFVAENHSCDSFEPQGLADDRAARHRTQVVVISMAQLDQYFRTLAHNVGYGRRVLGVVAGGSVTQNMGEYRLGIFPRLEREMADAPRQLVKQVFLEYRLY